MFVIAVLVLATVAVASGATASIDNVQSKWKAVFANTLNHHGLPNMQSVSNSGELDAIPTSHATTTYSSKGFIAQAFSSDSTCSTSDLSTGLAVNVCFVEEGFAYKVRLVRDSCIGGIVEYYYDKGCTEKAGTSRLEDLVSAPCAPLPGVQPARYVSHICTTKDKPPVRVDSAVTLHYRGDKCGIVESYTAIPTGVCVPAPDDDDYYADDDDGEHMDLFNKDSIIKCTGGKMTHVYYEGGSDCSGTALKTVTVSDTCTVKPPPVEEDDANYEHYYGGSALSEGRRLTATAEQEGLEIVLRHTDAMFRGILLTDLANEPSLEPTAEPTAASTVVPTTATAPTTAAPTGGGGPSPANSPTLSPSTATVKSPTRAPTRSPTRAAANDDNGGYDDNWLDAPPSVSSTPFPTTTAERNAALSTRVVCQAAPPKATVYFTAKQTIRGITLEAFNADLTKNLLALKKTIASVIQGATEASITDIAVTAAASSAATAAVAIPFRSALRPSARRLATDGVLVSYKVTVQDTVLSADTIAGQLQSAVASGDFTAALQSFAASVGATGLENATSDEVDVDVPSEGSSSSEDDEVLSVGAIIGIAIGGFFFLVFAAAGLYFFCLRTKANSIAPASG